LWKGASSAFNLSKTWSSGDPWVGHPKQRLQVNWFG
jgi:hypothetical protein